MPEADLQAVRKLGANATKAEGAVKAAAANAHNTPEDLADAEDTLKKTHAIVGDWNHARCVAFSIFAFATGYNRRTPLQHIMGHYVL